MQKVIEPTILFKAVVPLVILTGVTLGLPNGGEVDVKALLELVLFIVGIISVAAVMRTDVARLNRWRDDHIKTHEKHEETHDKITEILAELKESKNSTERRLAHLERRR